jgi:hypothetical protein
VECLEELAITNHFLEQEYQLIIFCSRLLDAFILASTAINRLHGKT